MKKVLFALMITVIAWMVVLGMVASLPRVACALEIIGEPIEGNSWSQYVRESGVGGFDRIEVIRETGPGFKIPGLSNFCESGWSVRSSSESYVLATGTRVLSLVLRIIFPGVVSESSSFWFCTWDGAKCMQRVRVCNCGNGLSVPDASMVWLLGSAFVGFALFAMKKSKP